MKAVFITFYFFLLFFITLYGIHLYWMIIIYLKNKNRKIQPHNSDIGRNTFPMVTVQLPFYNEKKVAVRLIEAVLKFDWLKDKLEIQILDDSTDETCNLIHEFLHTYITENNKNELPYIVYKHRYNRNGFKAGALAEGLKTARGEYIAIFDADNLPSSDFLKVNLPFFNDNKIGMVQTRWGFLNKGESFLCRAQALFLDAHFIIEQQARFWGNLLFNFNGTAGIWRREAIDDAGGWQHDTLTEDLELSMRAQLAGWKFIYNNNYIVETELPNTIGAFKSQQYRWSKGAVETALKLLPRIIRSSLSYKTKVAAFMHLTNKFISLAVLILAVLLIPALYIRMESGISKLFLIDLPIFIAGTGSMSVFYGIAYHSSKKRCSIFDMLILPSLTSLGIALAVNNSKALISALLKKKTVFIRTPKSGSTEKKYLVIPSSYATGIDKTTFLEIFLAIYSFCALLIAFKMNLFFTLPFLATFFTGFLYFSIMGLKEANVK